MAAVAETLIELPPVDQVKLVLMRAITARLQLRFGSATGTWSRASRELEMDESEISKLRACRFDRFSLERLIDLCDRVGVELTLTTQ